MLDAIVTTDTRSVSVDVYRDALTASQKVGWAIEDIIGGEKVLDFTKRMLPESLARVESLGFLNDEEKRVLNQIRAHAYLSIFGLVEEFILPFVIDHIRPSLDVNDMRVRAFIQFAGEEAKHIQLFKQFSSEFQKNFGTECKVIGPPSEIAKAVLAHQPLAVALVILHIEWMTQRHYIDSVRDDRELDPQFKSLLKHHWLEEAQHAKLDAEMVRALAEGRSEEELTNAVAEYLEIGGLLDTGVRQQTLFDLEAFEAATGRTLTEDEREEFISVQHQGNRWTYLGTGMSHPKFLETVAEFSASESARLEEIAPLFS